MFIFSIRPMSYPNKYLSVATDIIFSEGYLLTVTSTNDQKSIAFTSKQSIINIDITGSPSLLYNPGANSFLYFEDITDGYGAKDCYASYKKTPSEMKKFYIKMINISTCYIYLNTQNGEPLTDYKNTYVLSYHAEKDRVYLSNSPLYPNEKIWLIDIYPQQD